ncbi:hypothetical protein LENED_012216 [Lentinula edodes]|uniref:Uncharacterized protein n=1 Tax=Lentinula edodes TaxID=5353 RepID=A0A1Q3ES23_LENED|nr:hypothetical protein LENED_012216 [Lentinula edodes]
MYGQCRLFTTFLIIQIERVGLRNELVFAIYLSAQAATREARKLAYGSWEFSNVIGDSIPIAKKVAPPSRFATQKTSSDISE